MSQRSVAGTSPRHSWQLLRFWEDDGSPDLWLERIVFQRGTTGFRPVADPGDPNAFAERLKLR